MPYTVEGKLVVAISSRALFDFEEENRVFDAQGERAYIDLQYARMNVPAKEGVAFRLVKKLLAFNTGEMQLVEVVILSKNDPVSGLRIFRSAESAGLKLDVECESILLNTEDQLVGSAARSFGYEAVGFQKIVYRDIAFLFDLARAAHDATLVQHNRAEAKVRLVRHRLATIRRIEPRGDGTGMTDKTFGLCKYDGVRSQSCNRRGIATQKCGTFQKI